MLKKVQSPFSSKTSGKLNLISNTSVDRDVWAPLATRLSVPYCQLQYNLVVEHRTNQPNHILLANITIYLQQEYNQIKLVFFLGLAIWLVVHRLWKLSFVRVSYYLVSLIVVNELLGKS